MYLVPNLSGPAGSGSASLVAMPPSRSASPSEMPFSKTALVISRPGPGSKSRIREKSIIEYLGKIQLRPRSADEAED